jgi:hypothetical protein
VRGRRNVWVGESISEAPFTTDDSLNALGVVNAIVRTLSRSIAFEEKQWPHLVVDTSSPSVSNSTSATVLVAFGSEEKTTEVLGDRLCQIGFKGGRNGSLLSMERPLDGRIRSADAVYKDFGSNQNRIGVIISRASFRPS